MAQFKLHFSTDTRTTSFIGHDSICSTATIMDMVDNGKYNHVADIEANTLEEVFMLSQHLAHSWLENDGVAQTHPGQLRSSMVGDLIETEDGEVFAIMGYGFKQMN